MKNWIIKDELPNIPKNEECLCIILNYKEGDNIYYYGCVVIAIFEEKTKRFVITNDNGNFIEATNFTHWCYLPSLPINKI